MSSSSNQPTIAVVGAGLTGLLIAQGLKKNGFQVAIFDGESRIDARPRDWTIVLHWALPEMYSLLPQPVVDSIPRAITNPYLHFDQYAESFVGYNSITGTTIFKNHLPGSRRISRQRLRRVLAEGLDIQWGKSFRSLTVEKQKKPEAEKPVHLLFEDGSTFDADYVVGTDGSASKVREALLGKEKAERTNSGVMFASGLVNYNDAAKVEALVKAHPVASVALGKGTTGGAFVVSVNDKPDDMASWTVQWIKNWPASMPSMQGKEALDYIKSMPVTLGDPYQSLIDWTPDGSIVHIDEMTYWVPIPFDNHKGHVTLAGDAAHPMLIYRGQGFQHGILDAHNYVQKLIQIRDAKWDAETAAEKISAYDADMIARGAKAVMQATNEAKLSFSTETVNKMMMVTQGHARSA